MNVLLLIPIARFKAVGQGTVTAADFRLGESARVPDFVRLPNRNFMNLLEVPMLFYMAGITAFLTQQTDNVVMTLAWAFVALRIGHSIVHLSYNHVIHRLVLFAISNVVVSAMWVLLLYRITSLS